MFKIKAEESVQSHVFDYEGYLSDSEASKLEEKLADYSNDSNCQIIVITSKVVSTSSYSGMTWIKIIFSACCHSATRSMSHTKNNKNDSNCQIIVITSNNLDGKNATTYLEDFFDNGFDLKTIQKDAVLLARFPDNFTCLSIHSKNMFTVMIIITYHPDWH